MLHKLCHKLHKLCISLPQTLLSSYNAYTLYRLPYPLHLKEKGVTHVMLCMTLAACVNSQESAPQTFCIEHLAASWLFWELPPVERGGRDTCQVWLSQNNSQKQFSFFYTFTVPPPVERGGRHTRGEYGSQKIILKNKSLFLAHLLCPLQLKEEGVTRVVNMVLKK